MSEFRSGSRPIPIGTQSTGCQRRCTTSIRAPGCLVSWPTINGAPQRAWLRRFTVGARDAGKSYGLTQREVQRVFLKNEENSRQRFPERFG
jgi:hypothetical protein